ncbi:MAG: hypothetical protein ABSG71_20020 [Thermodesulfobacteriota bacterium]|jgi:hypothetical protein
MRMTNAKQDVQEDEWESRGGVTDGKGKDILVVQSDPGAYPV